MSLSTSLLSYSDCMKLMDAALEDATGARMRCHDGRNATHFRMRCQQARSLDREKNAQTYEKDQWMHGRSAYDRLVFRIVEDEGRYYVYANQIEAEMGEIEALSGLPAPEPQLQIENRSDPIEAEFEEVPMPKGPGFVRRV